MSSEIGKNIHISVFGESHGEGIGVVINGLPAGEPVDMEALMLQMSRRAPGKGDTSTPRHETDEPEILSGIQSGITTGAPLAAVIRNNNTRSRDYSAAFRPSHADYPAFVKYGGHNDIRGGGHFSGRLTAPLVFAGTVCREILERRGIVIGAHIYNIGGCFDTPLDPVNVTADELRRLKSMSFPVIDEAAGQRMTELILKCKADGNSVGGGIELAAAGLPAGLGSPMFGGVENVLSALIFGIPAIKGLEFGDGFAFSSGTGSELNDEYKLLDGKVVTVTNHNGGILGGITTGMPLILKVAVKPTPSIAIEQTTVTPDMTPTRIKVGGRHDPCIVPRAVPAVESAAAIGLLDILINM